MEPKEILTLLFERGNSMQAFWGFYITISLGVLAFFGNSQRSTRLAIITSLAFLGFATVNCSGMYDIARQRKVLFDYFASVNSSRESDVPTDRPPLIPSATALELMNASAPPDPKGVVLFHVFADISVLIGLWLLTLRQSS